MIIFSFNHQTIFHFWNYTAFFFLQKNFSYVRSRSLLSHFIHHCFFRFSCYRLLIQTAVIWKYSSKIIFANDRKVNNLLSNFFPVRILSINTICTTTVGIVNNWGHWIRQWTPMRLVKMIMPYAAKRKKWWIRKEFLWIAVTKKPGENGTSSSTMIMLKTKRNDKKRQRIGSI